MMEFRAAFGWPEIFVYMGCCVVFLLKKYLFLQKLEYTRNGTKGENGSGICA